MRAAFVSMATRSSSKAPADCRAVSSPRTSMTSPSSAAAGFTEARPDTAAARACRPAARLQPVRRLRQRYADEARPARHDHRLHHDAGAHRRPRSRRQDHCQILDEPDERRHGVRDVHDARGHSLLDPDQDPVLHARRCNRETVRLCRQPDRGPRDLRPRRSSRGRGMIDEFELMPQEEPFDPFAVMLFKALQVLAFLFFIALLAIAPEAKDGKVDSKAEFLVTMSWPDQHPDHFDMFVQDPLGNMVWYRRREAGFMLLDRDDRGGANDFILVNGRKILSPIRQETVSIRGIVAGEYTVNVYHFVAMGREPVPVSVKVEKPHPSVQGVHYGTIMLQSAGTERTAVRFSIDNSGAIMDVNSREKSLLQTLRNARRNAG